MIDPGFWRGVAGDMAAAAAELLPRLLMAALVLAIGWIVAQLCQAVVRGVLRRIGIDGLSERAGFAEALVQLRIDRSAAALLGRVVYWLVLSFFVLVALEGLGLTAVTETLQLLVGYIPNVLAGLLVIILGSFLARVAGDAVAAVATQYGVTGSVLLGQGVRWTLVIFAAVLALEQLQLDTSLITAVIVIVVGAAALALALALGHGTRELAAQMVAGLHASETFEVGQRLRVGDHEGRLVAIGAATALLETADGHVSIPNDRLLREVVLIVRSAGERGPVDEAEAD